MLLINMKAYRQGTGDNAEKMVESIEEAAENFEEEVVVAVQPSDIPKVADRDVKIYAEHIDPVTHGSHTGSVLPEAVKAAGAEGTLVNHSEKRLDQETIRKTVERAGEVGLETVVCAQTPRECEEISDIGPDYIAYEPPELIGGDTSVSEAKPELISEAVEASDPVPAMTGAGIKDRKDVEKSIERGCEGVLVASGVVKSENPRETTENLLEGL